MGNNIVRLTMAQAIVRYLVNQYTEIDGVRVPLFAGAFGIFGMVMSPVLPKPLSGCRISCQLGAVRTSNLWRLRLLPLPRPRKDARL